MNNNASTKAIQFWFRKSLPFWLILPTAIVLLIVQFYPAVYTGWLSFQSRTPQGWKYVGFDNFSRLFKTGQFAESIGHTIIFLSGYTIFTVSAAFIIAYLLKQNVPLSGVYITLLFIPWIIADIIAGLVFRLLVVPEYGILNNFFNTLNFFLPDGISVLTASRPDPWLGDFPFPPAPAMIYLILAASWRALPFVTLLILAALQTVPREVIESAQIDGANGVRLAQHITIPLILPAMVVAIFNLLLGGMNGVGMVFSLTGGGPGTTTYVLSYLLYTLGWTRLEFGQAAALAIILAMINWFLIMLVLRITRVNERTR